MKFKKTPVEARKLWVKALRSGKYKQTEGKLRDKNGFCCLGVACEVFRKTEGRGDWIKTKVLKTEVHDTPCVAFRTVSKKRAATEVLPAMVKKWLGLTTDNGLVVDDNISHCTLTEANDYGQSFENIANVIEEGKVDIKKGSVVK